MDATEKSDLYTQDLTDVVWVRSAFTIDNRTDYNCVEWATVPGGVAVRDSKNPQRGALMFTDAEWSAFTRGVAEGKTRTVDH